MPHIVDPGRYPSKKAFKAAVVENPDRVYCSDPSIFPGACSGYVPEILAQKGSFTVTNHPKRSWFASVERKGEKVVVK